MERLGPLSKKLAAIESQKAFGATVVEALRAAGLPEPITFIEADFAVSIGVSETINLSNFFKDIGETGDLDLILARIVTLAGDGHGLLPPFAEIRTRLIPVIRGRHYLERPVHVAYGELNQLGQSPYVPLTDDLGVTVAVNSEQTLRIPTQFQYEVWSVQFAEAHAVAIENLKEWPFESFYEDAPGVMVLEDDGEFAASALLRPDVLATAGIGEDAVAMIPDRNTLLMAASHDAVALRHMAGIAKEALEKSRPLSGFCYRAIGTIWQRFPADREGVVDELENLNRLWLANLYEEQCNNIKRFQQKALDEERMEALEQGWFAAVPADLILMERAESIVTFCCWGESYECFLPEADFVIFPQFDVDARNTGYVPWAEVRKTFGHLMTPMGWYPERYFVSALPEPADIRRLSVKLG